MFQYFDFQVCIGFYAGDIRYETIYTLEMFDLNVNLT